MQTSRDFQGLIMLNWLTINEAAEYTKVSERTIRTWMKGGLKYSRIGGLVRIDSIHLL